MNMEKNDIKPLVIGIIGSIIASLILFALEKYLDLGFNVVFPSILVLLTGIFIFFLLKMNKKINKLQELQCKRIVNGELKCDFLKLEKNTYNNLTKATKDKKEYFKKKLDKTNVEPREILNNLFKLIESVTIDTADISKKIDGVVKVSLGVPLNSGKFKVYGINFPLGRIEEIEEEANWKGLDQKKSGLFSKGMLEYYDRPYVWTMNSQDKVAKETKINDYDKSIVDFVIPIIKRPEAYKNILKSKKKLLPDNCLGVVSIGATNLDLLPQEKEEELYNRIKGVVNCIESVLILNKMSFNLN
jgi:hypothetical protein